jgi:hypothetical protein
MWLEKIYISIISFRRSSFLLNSGLVKTGGHMRPPLFGFYWLVELVVVSLEVSLLVLFCQMSAACLF